MPRKRKLEKKQVTVVVRGTPVTVILHPPEPPRNAWYAYPKGRKEVELISPNTVLKWSRSLQAAFVPESKPRVRATGT
jgi:hypothetical protein